MQSIVGTIIGRYKIIEEISHDEITGVYKAQDIHLDRQVTLKIVMRSSEYSEAFAQQFLGEARSLAKLSHPNILKVLDFGQDVGYLYMVTEVITGHTLTQFTGQKMGWESAAQLLLCVAEALDYAHNQGIIHRDLKPENIHLNAEQQPMLGDFSITRLVEEEETREMTGTNVGLGSPFYMSPEQGKGMRVDYRADIYALGIIFYELVTGHKPFEGGNSMEVVIQQVTLAPPPPRNYVPDLPKPIEELILTAIEKDPDERFQSMREFIDAIQQAKEVGSGGKQRKVQISTTRQILAIAGGICILVALLGSGIWYSTKHNMPTNTPKTSIASTEITATAPTIEALISTELAPQAPTAIPTIEINELVTPYPTVASEFFSFPPYPQLAGTALPTTSEAITAQNASKIIEILRLGNPVNHTIVWSPNEEFIYMGTESGIYIFPTKGKQPQYMIDARGAITSLAISSDAKLLAAGGRNGLIQIFEAHTGKTVFELPGHTNEVRTLNFSADGLRLISGSKDGTARVWDLSLGSELLKLSGHGSNINDAEFTPDGAYAITGSDDYSIRIWDTATGTPKAKLDVNGIVNDLEVSHDGKMVAAAMNDPRVELWSLETNRRLLTLKDTNLLTPIYGIGLSPNSRLVAVAAGDGRLRIFNTLNGEMLNNFLAAGDEKNPIAVTRAIYSANGTQLLVESADGLITQWNLTAQQIIHTIEFPAEKVEKFAVSPDGKILAVQEGNTNLILYSLEYGTKLGSIDGWLPEGSPFHTESKKLAVVRKDGLYLLSLSGTGQRLGLFPNDSTVAFTSDGKRLIIAGERRIELWITETGLRGVAGSLEFEGNCQSAYTDHGDYIASGMRFLAINNRDFADFACQVKRDPRTLDTSMAVPNTVVFALNDGTGQVWVKGDNPMPRLLGGGTGRAQAVAVTSDGTLIALGGEDSQIRIYDTQGTIVATLNHHTSDILDLHFTEDKQMLISLSEDGTIEVWGLVSQEK